MKKFKNGQGKLKKAQRIYGRLSLNPFYGMIETQSKAGIKYTKLIRIA